MVQGAKTSLFILLTVLAFCSSTLADVNWTGCGITKKAFMSEVAKAFEAKTGIKVNISGGGATKGIRAASAGSADMGGSCRGCLKEKDGSVHKAEKDAEMVQVAWDALVFIAHPDNPVKNISMDNMRKVFDGEITSWKELGGDDGRIILMTRKGKTSGVGHMFRWLAFGDPEYAFKARSMKVKSTGPLEKAVEKKVRAAGIDGISSARKRKVKFLSVDGIAPTMDNIASGKYPLIRPLYVVVKKGASAETKKLVEFIKSAEGQAIIAQQGTVNMKKGGALKNIWQKTKARLGLK